MGEFGIALINIIGNKAIGDLTSNAIQEIKDLINKKH